MSLVFEPIGSWLLATLGALGLVALALATDRFEARRWQTGEPRPRAMTAFRMLAAFLVALALFRPAIRLTETDRETLQLMLVGDASRSMSTTDAAGGQSRFQVAQADMARIAARVVERGNRRVSVQQRFFAAGLDALQPAGQPADVGAGLDPADATTAPATTAPPTPATASTTTALPSSPEAAISAPTGTQTAIGLTLVDLAAEVRRQRTLAVMLFSDGAQRALPPLDTDPLLAARELGVEQVPVFAVGYGSTSFTSQNRDLALEDLLVDAVLFEKKLAAVSVRLRATGASGQRVLVRLVQEDRSGKAIGEPGVLQPIVGGSTGAGATPNISAGAAAQPQREVVLRGPRETIPIDLSFVPSRSGELKLGVEVVPLDGEVLTRNNLVTTLVTVRPGGLRVAYFDVVRTEVKSLTMVNGAQNIQLDYHEVRGGRFAARTRIDPAWFERDRYEVFVLGDIPAEAFPRPIQEALAQRLFEGAGCLMIGGLRNFSAGGWDRTPLADYLPVRLGAAAPRPVPDSQVTGEVQMIPTELGLRRYVMQLAAGEANAARWKALAPLVGASRLTPKHDLVEVWARDAAGSPLLAATEVGRARVAAFAGDTTWQWVLHDQAADHQRFWRQLILWLARKDNTSTQPVWARIEPRNFAPGAIAIPEFGARRADGSPAEHATFQVEVLGPNNRREKIVPFKRADEHQAEYRSTFEPGDYWVRVTAEEEGRSLGPEGVTRFVVDPRDLELDNPSSDFDLLQQISATTGGQVTVPEELDAVVDRLLDSTLSSMTRERTRSLWDQWWYLALFVLCLTGEWVLRKRAGLA